MAPKAKARAQARARSGRASHKAVYDPATLAVQLDSEMSDTPRARIDHVLGTIKWKGQLRLNEDQGKRLKAEAELENGARILSGGGVR